MPSCPRGEIVQDGEVNRKTGLTSKTKETKKYVRLFERVKEKDSQRNAGRSAAQAACNSEISVRA